MCNCATGLNFFGPFIDPVDRNPLFLFVWTYIAMYWPPLVSVIDPVDTNPTVSVSVNIHCLHCNELTSFGFIHWPSWCEPTDHVPCFSEQDCTAVAILTILVTPNTIETPVVGQWKEIKCSFEVSMRSMSGFCFSQSSWHQTRSSLPLQTLEAIKRHECTFDKLGFNQKWPGFCFFNGNTMVH